MLVASLQVYYAFLTFFVLSCYALYHIIVVCSNQLSLIHVYRYLRMWGWCPIGKVCNIVGTIWRWVVDIKLCRRWFWGNKPSACFLLTFLCMGSVWCNLGIVCCRMDYFFLLGNIWCLECIISDGPEKNSLYILFCLYAYKMHVYASYLLIYMTEELSFFLDVPICPSSI